MACFHARIIPYINSPRYTLLVLALCVASWLSELPVLSLAPSRLSLVPTGSVTAAVELPVASRLILVAWKNQLEGAPKEISSTL